MSCLFELKIRNIFKTIHDDNKYWIKQKTIAKFQKLIYWLFTFIDVKKYFRDCLSCVLHDFVLKFQFFYSVCVWRSFQFINFDFIEFFYDQKEMYLYFSCFKLFVFNFDYFFNLNNKYQKCDFVFEKKNFFTFDLRAFIVIENNILKISKSHSIFLI